MMKPNNENPGYQMVTKYLKNGSVYQYDKAQTECKNWTSKFALFF